MEEIKDRIRDVAMDVAMDGNLSLSFGNSIPEWTVDDNQTQLIGAGRPVSALIEQISTPIICIMGLIGNTLSFVVFVQESYRKSSCRVFLAARCLSDNGFLVALMLVWSSMAFDLQLSHVSVMCQVIIFLTYVCGCTSVWLVVFVTTENYIRIAKPHLVNRLCTMEAARAVVCCLLVVVVCCYTFPFWSMDARCGFKSGTVVRFMVYLDTFLTLIVPTVVMGALMVVIVSQMFRSNRRRKRLSTTSSSSLRAPRQPITKVTKMLLAVTLTYFILNLPSHAMRISIMIRTIVSNGAFVGSLDAILQTISLQIYYLSLSVNVFVYCVYGGKFRSVLVRTCLIPGRCRQLASRKRDISADPHTSSAKSSCDHPELLTMFNTALEARE